MDSRLSEPGLFGNQSRTKILLAIYLLNETYPSELAQLLGRSVSRIQDAVVNFEQIGVVLTRSFAGARVVSLNSNYFAYEELRPLLQKLALKDIELQEALAAKRRRPRKMKKAI